MLDKLVADMKLSPEEFISTLKPLIESKRKELDSGKFKDFLPDL